MSEAAGSEGKLNSQYPTAQRWVDEHEKKELECQRIMMEAAARCAPIRAQMKDVKAAAKNDGIGAKVFAAILTERKHLKNAAKVREKLEDHDDGESLVAELDNVRASLAPMKGLPLADAAIEAAEQRAEAASAKRRARSDALDDLVAPAPPPAEDTSAADAIRNGIKQLDS